MISIREELIKMIKGLKQFKITEQLKLATYWDRSKTKKSETYQMGHQELVKHLEHLVHGESEKHNTQLRQK